MQQQQIHTEHELQQNKGNHMNGGMKKYLQAKARQIRSYNLPILDINSADVCQVHQIVPTSLHYMSHHLWIVMVKDSEEGTPFKLNLADTLFRSCCCLKIINANISANRAIVKKWQVDPNGEIYHFFIGQCAPGIAKVIVQPTHQDGI